MQALANLLNKITSPIKHRIAFEATSYPVTASVERLNCDTSTVWLIMGKLRVIMN